MDNNNEQPRILIRPYDKAWKIENRVYAIGNIVLPFPIEPKEILYFFVSAFAVYGLSQIFPPLKNIPVILRYAVMPFGFMKLLVKLKLDGMDSVTFFRTLIVHLFTYRLYTENFREYSSKEYVEVKPDWWCGSVATTETAAVETPEDRVVKIDWWCGSVATAKTVITEPPEDRAVMLDWLYGTESPAPIASGEADNYLNWWCTYG